MAVPITFHREDVRLQGKLHPATGEPPFPTLILLQGSPGNTEDVLGLGAELATRGYNTLTFNYSGTQESGGFSSFENTQADIAAAFGYLADNCEQLDVDPDRVILGGWSYGGGMGLTYAANNPEVRAVFSIAGTDHGEFMREYQSDPVYHAMIDEIFESMQQLNSPWRLAPGATPSEIGTDLSRIQPFDLREVAAQLSDRHILLVGGWEDLNVKIEKHLVPLYRALVSHGAQHVRVELLWDDHGFSNVRAELVDLLVDWMAQVESSLRH